MPQTENNPTGQPRDLHSVVKAYDVRGLVGTELDGDVCRALGAAFAEEILAGRVSPGSGGCSGAEPARPVVAVGHDMRPSSPELSGAFAAGVCSRGVDVVLIGLCSTDGLYYASGRLDAPGAMFTASHNPAAYNGIKLCGAGARPISLESGLARIRDRAEELLAAGSPAGSEAAGSEAAGSEAAGSEAAGAGTLVRRDLLSGYAGYLRGLVDLTGIRPLRVVVDAGNGMAGLTTPAVLGTAAGLAGLPVTVLPLYFELDGTFPNHEANPLDPANLVDLQAAVREYGADAGLAFDGDADRCFVVDERGEPVSPSAVTALVACRQIAAERAEGRTATVIHNLITSRAVPEMITTAGGRPVRTRVGHSFIKAEMASEGAVFGGEHSAHYYFRDFWNADTGMLAALHVLAALGEQPGRLSELTGQYQRYHASGEINSRVTDVATATKRVSEHFAVHPGTSTDHLDGLTVSHAPTPDEPTMWWFNLRPSNTEPLLRLNAEAGDHTTMTRIRDDVLALIRQ